MNYVDFIIVAFVIFIMILNYFKGFVYSAISLGRVIVTIPLGIVASSHITPVVMDEISPLVIESINQKLQASSNLDEFFNSINSALSALPQSVFGFLQNKFESISIMVDTQRMAEEIYNSAIQPVVSTIVRVLMFVIVSALISCLIWAVSRLLIPKKDSLLGKTDRLLGAVLGLVKAAVVVFVFCAVINAFAEITPKVEGDTFVNALNDSLIIQKINEVNPINKFI